MSIIFFLQLPFLPPACYLCSQTASHPGYFTYSQGFSYCLYYQNLIYLSTPTFFSFKHISFTIGNYNFLLKNQVLYFFYLKSFYCYLSPIPLNSTSIFFSFFSSVLSHTFIPVYLSKLYFILSMPTATVWEVLPNLNYYRSIPIHSHLPTSTSFLL